MENKTIRRTLYRVLRKTGVARDHIELEASFQDDLNFDQVDWAIFLYYMEDSFHIAINEEDVSRLNQVKDSLELVENNA
ncbi:MAG: acyl carrier protein [Prolixibacteraceae bacterium]|jgi:acyl carrier protein